MSDTTDIGRLKDTALLDRRIDAAAAALRADQRADGHWVYELEADATIPAEYVLLTHYLGEEANLELERKIAVYLRSRQSADGGWPLFHNGAFDISASVKAYFALKMIGDDPDATHMRTAREAIRARGGAAQVNVFTRFLLALYGILPWSALPLMPVEITLLPRWFFFHLSKISYWGRTVLVPLLVLQALKPRARNRGVRVDELFLTPPGETKRHAKAPHQNRFWYEVFRAVDVLLKLCEPAFPRATRKRAIDKAAAFVRERLNGEDGLGAIFPAMANSVMMFDALGVPADNPERAIARKSIDKLLVVKAGEAYCQPCVSPVWDTALAAHALLETGDGKRHRQRATRARLARPAPGARREGRLGVQAAGRAARRLGLPIRQPALSRSRRHRGDRGWHGARAEGRRRRKFDAAMARAREWIEGTADRATAAGAPSMPTTRTTFLNNIPFADHGALLDPPSPDLTARCVSMLAQLGATMDNIAAHAARRRLSAPHAAARRLLVRPLGHQLHLRHLVVAVRAQRRGTWPRCAGNETRRRLADRDPERGRRLGRGRRQLQTQLPRPRAERQHAVANRLGFARPDGGGASRTIPPSRAASTISWPRNRRTACGASAITPAPVSRACSTCATTAIRNSSRCGRWRATAISNPPTPAAWPSAYERALCRGARPAFSSRHGSRMPAAATKVCCGRGTHMAVALATATGTGCAGIISFGIAGGLDPQLRAGAVIVASSVIGANGVKMALPADERWSQRLLRALPQARHAPVLGVDVAVTEPADKIKLFRQTGAAVADMESHIAASVAASHGLPFAVLRVVSDPAGQRIPQAALAGMREDGVDRCDGRAARAHANAGRSVRSARRCVQRVCCESGVSARPPRPWRGLRTG